MRMDVKLFTLQMSFFKAKIRAEIRSQKGTANAASLSS